MQALNSPASRPTGVVNNPLPATTEPVTGPVLPGQETVSVLQVSGKHKRKTTDRSPEPDMAPKRLQTQPHRSSSSSSSSATAASRSPDLTSEVTPIKKNPMERVADMLRNPARFSALQMGRIIRQSAQELAGQAMTETDRDALLTQILGAHASCTAHQMGSMIYGLGGVLGGSAMTAANRDALFTQILSAHATCDTQKTEGMIDGLGQVLGGPIMTAANRDALLTQILGAHASRDNETIGTMIYGLGNALGGPAMTAINRDALLTQIIGAHTTCSSVKMCTAIGGLGTALGGPAMTAANRDVLFTQVFGAHAICSAQTMAGMVAGLSLALGGPALTAANRDALLTQIIGASATCNAQQISEMFCGLGLALGPTEITAQGRAALVAQILGAHATCSAQNMCAMIDGLGPLGGLCMTTENRVALVVQILSAHATIAPEKIAAMISHQIFWAGASEVLPKIYLAGATPMKTGMIIAALMGKYTSAQQRPESRRILNEGLTAIQAEPRLRACVEAGCLAASGDIAGILTLDELTDSEKLQFIRYSCNELITLDLPSLRAELGKTVFLPLSDALKNATLSTLLKSGPFDPALFGMVRKQMLGALSQIPDISWQITEEGAEVLKSSSGFADWYIDVQALYQESSYHMPLDFIRQEKELIRNHRLLPAQVKKSILDLLRVREEELTKAGLD
ncbi:hypothetical protein AAKU67_002841 [Oxalobacteraceae bacterium GrIS 2.11]